MDDDSVIHKAEFLAEFFCSPLAVEVYKDSGGDTKVEDLNSFANALWDLVSSAIEEDNESDGTDWS